MLTIREVIKTFYNALLQRLKKHRGNWEQNDPTADDYIKNRPFYTDETNKETVIKTKTFTADCSYWWGSPFAFIPVVGDTYKVTFDGKEYICQSYLAWGECKAIGNIAIDSDGQDTGEPFFYYWYDSSDYGLCVRYQGSHTIMIEKIEVEKLDKRYLPDLGLAPVATSGSYYDLEDTPTIYTDVVRYGTSQSLTTSQKAQARTNIGAAATSDLATVANSGDYNDLENKPCSKIITDAAYVGVSGCSAIVGVEGHCFNFTSFPAIDDSQYVAFKLTAYKNSSTVYLQTEYVQHHDYQYKNGAGADCNRRIWGNANLVDATLPNTGENWFVYYNINYSSSLYVGVDGLRDKVDLLSSGWFGYSLRNIELVPISDELIPNTITRNSNLATVATTGSYNDLIDRPVYEDEKLVDVYHGDYTGTWYLNNNQDTTAKVYTNYNVLFSASLQESVKAEELYTLTITSKNTSKQETITGTMEFYEYIDEGESDIYQFYIIGNKYLLPSNISPFTSITKPFEVWDMTDSGENLCWFECKKVHAYTGDITNTYTYLAVRYNANAGGGDCGISFVRNTTDLKQLDEKYIPDTIARIYELPQSNLRQSDTTAADYVKGKTHGSEDIFTNQSADLTRLASSATTYNSDLNIYHGCCFARNLYTTLDDYKDANKTYALRSHSDDSVLEKFKFRQLRFLISNGSGTSYLNVWGNAYMVYQYVGKEIYATLSDATNNNPLTQDELDTGESFAFAIDTNGGDYLGTSGCHVYSREQFGSDIYVYEYAERITQLDEKFIPSTIARTEDIEGLATEAYVDSKISEVAGVKSVNNTAPDENGNITITIPDTVTDDHINSLIDAKAELPTVTTSDNGSFLRVVDGVWAVATIPNAEEASF